jgi:hypothetical protein
MAASRLNQRSANMREPFHLAAAARRYRKTKDVNRSDADQVEIIVRVVIDRLRHHD